MKSLRDAVPSCPAWTGCTPASGAVWKGRGCSSQPLNGGIWLGWQDLSYLVTHHNASLKKQRVQVTCGEGTGDEEQREFLKSASFILFANLGKR